MATPVTLVPNGTPATPTLNAMPVTIVDASGQPTVAVVSNSDTVTVQNSAGANNHPATATVAGGVLTGAKLAATAAMVDNAQVLTIPITGTYVSKITLTVAGGVVTAGVLS